MFVNGLTKNNPKYLKAKAICLRIIDRKSRLGYALIGESLRNLKESMGEFAVNLLIKEVPQLEEFIPEPLTPEL